MQSTTIPTGAPVPRATVIMLALLLGVFAATAVFFAVRLQTGIIPDERQHVLVTRAYATTWGLPEDGPQTYALGPLGNQPFLYYWLHARALNLVNWLAPAASPATQLLVLRLLNVVYALAGLVFVFLFAKEVIGGEVGPLLVVFLLTSTLMFVFLAGGYNYDNLLNACCFAALYYMARVFNDKDFIRNSVLCLLSILLGAAVKFTMLPLGAIIAVLWIVFVLRNRQKVVFRLYWSILALAIGSAGVALALINIAIYGAAVIKYGTILPSCAQILTHYQCMQYPQYARLAAENLPSKLGLLQAIVAGYPDPLAYGLTNWGYMMFSRVYGILGHRSYFPASAFITLHRLFFLLIVAIAIRHWKKSSYLLTASGVTLLFYLLTLLWYNYNLELASGFKTIGVQGRYTFPVIGIYYTLMVYFLLQIRSGRARFLAFLAGGTLFLLGSPLIVLYRGWSTVFAGWFH